LETYINCRILVCIPADFGYPIAADGDIHAFRGTPMLKRFLGTLIVSCAGAVAVGGEPASEHGFGITLLTGYETNPQQQTDDGASAVLGQLGVDGFYRRAVTDRLTLFADGTARDRRHESAADGADTASLDARAGASLAPLARLRLLAGAEHSLYRATFLDRETGEVYEVDATPIPGRLDHDATGLFVNARWQHDRRWLFFLDTSLDEVRYVDDYAETTDLEPLDYRALRLEPGVSFAVTDTVQVLVSAGLTDLDYDEQSALDAEGDRVEGTRRSYRSTLLRARAKLEPWTRWKLYVGTSTSDRDDLHAGYYDYGAWSSYASVDRELGERGTLRLFTSRMQLDYANATVSADPEGPTRDSEISRLLARYEHDLLEPVGVFVELGSEQADSRDAAYSYDSDWLMAGIRYRR
jgi:hypothetical protein